MFKHKSAAANQTSSVQRPGEASAYRRKGAGGSPLQECRALYKRKGEMVIEGRIEVYREKKIRTAG